MKHISDTQQDNNSDYGEMIEIHSSDSENNRDLSSPYILGKSNTREINTDESTIYIGG